MELILFDLGGVLIELEGLPFKAQWLPIPGELLNDFWISSCTVKSYESGRCTSEEFAQEIISELKLDTTVSEFIEHFNFWPKSWFPGASEFLMKLRIKYTTACLSNSNELHWERALKEWKIDQFFHYSFASHLIGSVKPESAPFIHVIEKTGIPPEKIVFFDDNIKNVESAEKLGIKSYHVKNFEETRILLEKLVLI